MVINILIGILLGFLSGLGVGGGSLLILWLTLGLGMEQAMARDINLMFFPPAAVIAACFRWRQGSLPLRKIWPAMISGSLSAAVLTFVSRKMDVSALKQGYGILLLATGFRELFFKTIK